jgi:hypothetical protein
LITLANRMLGVSSPQPCPHQRIGNYSGVLGQNICVGEITVHKSTGRGNSFFLSSTRPEPRSGDAIRNSSRFCLGTLVAGLPSTSGNFSSVRNSTLKLAACHSFVDQSLKFRLMNSILIAAHPSGSEISIPCGRVPRHTIAV